MAAIAYPIPRQLTARPHLDIVPGPPLPQRRGARALRPGIYARRRAAVVLAAATLVVAVRLVLGLGGGPLTAPERLSSPAAPAVHVVQPGDTIWSVARSLHPDGDIRPLVDRLVAAHHGTALRVGERIALR